MLNNVSLSVNGQSRVPPGFRFHPTEKELLHYYLRKKVAYEKIDLDVVRDVDLNKLEPWDIQKKCRIGSTPQNDWYLFSHKDKKYPTGTQTNRATAAGFWKATGRDKAIYSNGTRIGMRKTLVFYRGRAPHGRKSDWIMHEYRLDDNKIHDSSTQPVFDIDGGHLDQSGTEEGWVICRVFKKKDYRHKASSVSQLFSSDENINANNIFDQILMYIGKSSPPSPCKPITSENHYSKHYNDHTIEFSGPAFAYLPGLEILALNATHEPDSFKSPYNNPARPNVGPSRPDATDWATLELLLASQLNGHPNYSEQLCSFASENIHGQDFINDHDHEDLDMQNCNGSNHRIISSSSHAPDFWSIAG